MFLLYFITLFFAAASASPFDFPPHTDGKHQSRSLEVRQNNSDTLDCSASSRDGIQAECWEYLKMNDYLQEWWSTNSAECNAKNLGFSACYLELAGYITWQCDFIALNACVPPPSGASAEYKSPQEFYVFWNIYTINLFWTNYHAGVLQGQATAVGAVAEIVGVVSPPKTINPNTPLFSPIWFVSLGFLAALGPLIGPVGGSIAFAAAQAPLSGVSGVYGILFEKKQVQEVKWEEISAAMSDNVNEYQGRIGKALTEIQTNFDTFYNVTSGGYYSQKFNTNLPENTEYMYHDLLKWVFNQALEKAGWFISKSPGVDPRLMPTKGFLSPELDRWNATGPVWYDGKDSYGLVRANDIGADQGKAILEVAFEKNWITPQELYIDAASCRGRNGSEAFDPNQPFLTCASNLPVCEYYFDFNPYQAIDDLDYFAEYSNCPGTRGFGRTMNNDRAGVPQTYLGPYLMSGYFYNENTGPDSG